MRLTKAEWSEIDRVKSLRDGVGVGALNARIDFLCAMLDKLRPKKIRYKYKRVKCIHCNGWGKIVSKDAWFKINFDCIDCGGFGYRTEKIPIKSK